MKKVFILIVALAVAAMLFTGCAQCKEPSVTTGQTTPSTTSSMGQSTPSTASSPEQTNSGTAIATAPNSPEPATGPSTGTIQVLVTDAPKHDVSRVELTVSEVEVHKAGSDNESGNWTTLAIQEKTFNLLDLQNGLTMLLADGEIEAGTYTQLRMTVFSVVVDYDDVVGAQAEVPSGELKFVRPFTLEAGDNITLIVDIDAAKSVVITGGSNQDNAKVLFKPVVKLQVVPGQGPVTEAPTVLTYSPSDNATGVSQNATLILNFDDYMAKGTGNITIKRYSDNSTFEIIDVTSSDVTITGTEVIIDPTGTFEDDTGYYVFIDEGALTDDAGNSYAGIVNKDTWNFTT
jgi:PBP1b-binding outer membrane lipoprotein LpoB